MLKLLTNRSLLVFAVITLLLAVFPLIHNERATMIVITHIFILAVFAMSYDLLLGYTGIVSFGHVMFFGIGAYSVAIIMQKLGPTIPSLLLAVVIGAVLSAILSYIVGMLSLRLKSHYYAMLTLAFSGLFLVIAEKWRSLTRGNDGFTFSIPDVLKDRLTFYYISFIVMIIVFLMLRRFTQSPLGRVLQSIRENEQRTQSLGYEIIHYKVIASVVAGVAASVSGALYVVTLRFVNTTVLAFDLNVDALLMTIIGGVGTLFGGILGAAIIELAHEQLTSLAKVHWIFERWIIFFGLLYILVVMLFPKGIVGTVRHWRDHRRDNISKNGRAK
ncbi:branched-chain amino acid ABC transporter permease [Paenibacillus sedimenti]|uniref:Branched-chain amino acid ABC transporter permease n=1 Tax=Paenibacillus sedimenti TaxID=2770274 RepID=A0A926KMH8_9BACL|nr:branched-chain amino acid ABC transporter permease [Paenibacillus sedimenti]MBD0378983.1 branched-chain amino acid ABC transporter permease [Paenibacillus sedimenti]